MKGWTEVSDETVDNVIATNYLAGDRLSRRVAPAMVAQGWGRIVNVTTKLDTMNRVGTHPYGASKAALRHMSAIWNEELAGEGVRVLSADPGDMDTLLHRIALPDADPATLKRPETAARELMQLLL